LFGARNVKKRAEDDASTLLEMVEAEVPEKLIVVTPFEDPLPDDYSPPLTLKDAAEVLQERLDAVLRYPAEDYERTTDLPSKYSELRHYYGYAPKEKGWKGKFKKAVLQTYRRRCSMLDQY